MELLQSSAKDEASLEIAYKELGTLIKDLLQVLVLEKDEDNYE